MKNKNLDIIIIYMFYLCLIYSDYEIFLMIIMIIISIFILNNYININIIYFLLIFYLFNFMLKKKII